MGCGSSPTHQSSAVGVVRCGASRLLVATAGALHRHRLARDAALDPAHQLPALRRSVRAMGAWRAGEAGQPVRSGSCCRVAAGSGRRRPGCRGSPGSGGSLASVPDARLPPASPRWGGWDYHRQYRRRAVEREDDHRSPRGAAAALLADGRPLRRAAAVAGDRRLRAGAWLFAARPDPRRPRAAGRAIPALAEVQVALQEAVAQVTGARGEALKRRLRTGTVVTYDDRNWELRWSRERRHINLSRASRVDMESSTLAAQGYRLRVPYGTLLCVSDKPLHGEIKLPGPASAFYQRAVGEHLTIGLAALDLLRGQLGALYSRKLLQLRRARRSGSMRGSTCGDPPRPQLGEEPGGQRTMIHDHAKWGPTDQVGAGNLLTAEKRLAALASVRQGRVYDVSHEIYMGAPDFGAKPAAVFPDVDSGRHGAIRSSGAVRLGATNDAGANLERIEMTTHVGTHIDALGHFRRARHALQRELRGRRGDRLGPRPAWHRERAADDHARPLVRRRRRRWRAAPHIRAGR